MSPTSGRCEIPKIEAATAAEHRSNQRRALLQAARGLLLDGGPDAVTPAALGRAVGLARNSVYKYFASSNDILAQLVETSFLDWAGQIRAAVAAQQTPSSRIDAYIRTTVELAAAGQHRIAGAVTAAYLPEPCRARIDELHRGLTEPLLSALLERGDAHPEITAALVQGALNAAVRLIHADKPPDDVLAAITQLLWWGTEADDQTEIREDATMFFVTNELIVDEEYREQFESTFPESMRATLPGVPGLVRANLLAPTEPGRGHLAIMEFTGQQAYLDYLDSDAFRAAHRWSNPVPLVSNTLTTYTVNTDMTDDDLAGTRSPA